MENISSILIFIVVVVFFFAFYKGLDSIILDKEIKTVDKLPASVFDSDDSDDNFDGEDDITIVGGRGGGGKRKIRGRGQARRTTKVVFVGNVGGAKTAKQDC
jgi:hypothetical protein